MVPGAEAEGLKTSITTETRMARTKRVTSIEHINRMCNDEIRSFSLSGRAKRRLVVLCGSMDYFQAKRQVIRENYERSLIIKDSTRVEGPMESERSKDAKRPRQVECSTLDIDEPAKKAKLEDETSTMSSTRAVAVVHKDHPNELLSKDQLNDLEESIMTAYEEVPYGGPQVRFSKCKHRTGYLLWLCEDSASAEWLQSVVPDLRLGDVLLKALVVDDILKAYICTYIPDAGKKRLTSEQVIRRLSTGNQSLKCLTWVLWEKVPKDKGVFYTFLMDKESMECLKVHNFQAYFPIGLTLKFWPKKGIY